MFLFIAKIIDYFTDLAALIIWIIWAYYLLNKFYKIKKENKEILFKVYAKNYINIFLLIYSLFFIGYYGFEFYDIISKNEIIINSKFVESMIYIILGLIQFSGIVLLLSKKSIINNDTILLTDGIFKISIIKNIEKEKNNILRIYFNKNTPFALLGNKKIKVNEKDLDNVYNYLNNKINNISEGNNNEN